MQCPGCGSTDSIPILYGLPTREAEARSERGEFALGGCIVGRPGGDPTRLCVKCGASYGQDTNAAPEDLFGVFDDQQLVEKTKLVMGGVSLNVFYTNPEAIPPGSIYVAGLNPGGAVDHDSQTPASMRGASKGPHGDAWCKYIDETWSSPMGRMTGALAARAFPGGEAALRRAFCTNALFMRGPVGEIEPTRLDELWEVCRPWHQKWIRQLRPKAIVCLGNRRRSNSRGGRSPYDWFRSLLGDRVEQPRRPLYRNTHVIKASVGTLEGERVLVLGFPHPSYWDPNHPGATEGIAYAAGLLAKYT